MDSFNHLQEIFSHFPGIGPRQAKRFVYYLLTKSPSFISEFGKLAEDLKKNTSECSGCFRFFINKGVKTIVCPICSDPNRDSSQLMIVSRDVDFESIEKSHVYNGLYFILGGTIPILEKEPEKKVRLKELKEKIKSNTPKEIILSLNITAEGENTAEYMRQFITSNFPDSNIKISILGRGLSTGSELEYVDAETIKSALQNRS